MILHNWFNCKVVFTIQCEKGQTVTSGLQLKLFGFSSDKAFAWIWSVRQETFLPPPYLWITPVKYNYLVSSDSPDVTSWIMRFFISLKLAMFFCNVIFMLIITSCVIANTSGQLSHSSNDSCLISKPDLLANSSHESSVPTRLLFLGSLMNLHSSNRILTTSLFPLCRDLSPTIL